MWGRIVALGFYVGFRRRWWWWWWWWWWWRYSFHKYTHVHLHTFMMFLTICTNYDPWLTVGETQFTHATQDHDHGAPQSQRRTVGASQYDPAYSSSSHNDTSQSQSFYPIPDINAQAQTTWVYEWEDPHFYNLLVNEWQTTSVWTSLTWQQYKAELLRVRGLNVMSITEYHSTSQMGVFPFYHWTFIVLDDLYRIICIWTINSLMHA
jgi:hypothetical protein